MSAARVPVLAPWSPPPMPAPRLPRGIAPPTPRQLAERALGNALAELAQWQHCLTVACERLTDAGQTHTAAITYGARKRVAIPPQPYTPERMAERRAQALARVTECTERVAAADLRVAEARWVLDRMDAAAEMAS